jgi:phosphonoacetate hydrolase
MHAPDILVVVFDGLRPDMITTERMPTLAAHLAAAKRYVNARSVFPSLTRVCAATIATGTPPATHHIVHNAFPDVAIAERFLDTSRRDHLEAAAAHHGPAFLGTPRFADHLAAAGKRFALVHSGSAGGVLLLAPRADVQGHWMLSVSGREHTITPAAWDTTIAALGAPPPRVEREPRLAEMGWAARALEVALREAKPDVAMIWLSEPDYSYHYQGLDSAQTRLALRASDDAFAHLLEVLRGLPGHERTQILAMSDHGHVAVEQRVDLAGALREAGFDVGFMRRGHAFAATQGTAPCFWAAPGADLDALARFLDEQSWCGTLFRKGDPALGPAPARGPDLVMLLASDSGPDRWGLPGAACVAGDEIPLGGGMHGGLHLREMGNLITLAGPGVAAGEDASAVSLVDIGGFILRAAGVSAEPWALARRSA